jgi:tetratricopeptide (TPR) repeat protein
MAWRSNFFTREILVAVWLAVAFGFLFVRLPGFWRSPYQRYEEARRLETAGRAADASAEMAMAIVEEPANTGYLVYQGNLQLRLGRPEEAERTFREALEHGDQVEASLGLARALQAKPAEARRVLQELEPRPLNHEQQFRRLSLLAALGDFDAATAGLGPIERQLSASERRDALRWAMAANDWPRAARLAEEVEQVSTDGAVRDEARLHRAVAMRAMGQLEAALALFDLTARPATLVPRAQLTLQLQLFDRAADLYRQLVVEAPDDVEARMALAYALEKSGRLNEASEVYREAVARAGPDARIKLATLLNVLKRHDDAWRTLEPLPRPSPDVATLRLQARTALWAGQLTTSAALFAALDGNRTNADDAVEADLAGTLVAAQRADDADRIYERLMAQDRLHRAARVAYADSLTERQRFDDAWRVLQTVTPVDDELVGRRARVAFWGGRYTLARPLLESWLARHPMDVERWRDAIEASRQLQDADAESKALRSYLALRPQDQAAAVRLAGLLEGAGQVDQAIEIYRQATQREPGRADLHRIVGYLLEQRGDRAEAIRAYARAWELSEPRDADLALTIARLYRPQAPGDALIWYTRAGAAKVGNDERRQLQLELAQSEVAAGRLDQAAARIDEVVRDNETNPDARVMAARIEAARANPSAAARHLRRLSELRPLTLDERRWLAGQLRLAGDTAGALAEYERVVTTPGAAAADFEAAGNLRAEAGNVPGALEAYASARRLGAPPSAELSLARLLAKIGRFDDAVEAYARYLKGGDPSGKRVELARAHLAAAQFQQAEQWAREASQSEERGPEADLILAQALYLSDRRRESDAIVARLPADLPQSASIFEQAGQLAAARDQHLRGIRWFGEALALAPANAGELHYWQGVSALKRGDYARALEHLERARLAGALPELARLARLEAQRSSAPTVWLPVRVSGDSNDLSTRQAGIGFTAWPGRQFPLSLEAVSGALSQRDLTFDRARIIASMGRALVRPRFGLNGYVGTERYDGRDGRLVGGAGATYYFEDRSALRLDFRRDSIWTERDRRDPRQFTRAVDLARVGPDFMIGGAELTFDKMLGTGREARVQLGVNDFQDGNLQGFLYGHYQFIVNDRPGLWTALRPNVYWEAFDRRTPAYFSPDGFYAVGGMWHNILSSPLWRLETELNPRLTWLDGRASYGLHGVIDVSRAFGPVSAGLGAFTFYDRRSDYWAWRLAAQVGVRLGR